MIPEKYGTLGALPLKVLLERVFPAVSSAICSAANAAQMLKSVKKASEKATLLLEHIEYFSGLPASFPLRESCSRFSFLLDRVASETRVRGRVSASTRLPMDFKGNGGLFSIDEIDAESEEIYVKMAVTRCIAKISASDFRKTPKDLSTVFIRFNHSESLAELASPEVKGSIVIRNHFKDTELKRALALEDRWLGEEFVKEDIQQRKEGGKASPRLESAVCPCQKPTRGILSRD
eukprot:4942907-Amphidinium_carterae.1